MAEKRKAGFNIPLNFYDGPEVESIPRRIRAAAIGVWSLAGNYAATQLTDGYVGPGMLKMFGCTDAIRAALKATINKKGEPSPLWVDARNGGIQLTNWAKHQRTNDEVTTYRANEAERKRLERLARAEAAASEDEILSGRTEGGQGSDVRSDAGDPKTKPKSEVEFFGYVTDEDSPNVGGEERGLSAPVVPSASRLVSVLIPDTIPAAVRTGLRHRASELINRDHLDTDIVAEALRRWLKKPGAGVGLLSAIASDVIRERAAPNNGKPKHKLRVLADLAAQVRAQEQSQIENQQRAIND